MLRRCCAGNPILASDDTDIGRAAASFGLASINYRTFQKPVSESDGAPEEVPFASQFPILAAALPEIADQAPPLALPPGTEQPISDGPQQADSVIGQVFSATAAPAPVATAPIAMAPVARAPAVATPVVTTPVCQERGSRPGFIEGQRGYALRDIVPRSAGSALPGSTSLASVFRILGHRSPQADRSQRPKGGLGDIFRRL